MSKVEDILLPDVGGEEVEIIEICVNAGDNIEEDEAIIVVETDKASMDIPASYDGKIVSLNVKAGDKIKEGDLICSMSSEGAAEEVAVTKEVAAPVVAPVAKEEVVQAAVEVVTEASTTVTIEDILVPDLGGDTDVDVIEILADIGDELELDDGLITLETDKATMDVPAPFTGKLLEIIINAGDKVSEGTLIARMEKTTVIEASKTVAAPVQEAKTSETKASASASKEVSAPANSVALSEKSAKVYASPSVRRLAREFGADLGYVKGNGRKNRILKEDVKAYIKAELSKPRGTSSGSGMGFNLPELKEIDFSKFGDIETLELSKIQKISGPSLHRNWVSMPHITQFDEADITELEKFRKEQNLVADGYKISPLVFVIKAVAKALEIHPNFNSSLSSDGNSVIMKKYFNIAVAVDTPNGLVVPVLKDVNNKGFKDISIELAQLSVKARDGKLKMDDISGACFTISSLGGIGGTKFTPIINAPEVAILGLSKSQIQPKWNGETFVPKLMLPLSLSYDHRVIDGADGARFTTTLSRLLGDIRLLSL